MPLWEVIKGLFLLHRTFRSAKGYRHPRYLDITIKSGDNAFAPNWKMVMGSNEGEISEKEYTRQYHG